MSHALPATPALRPPLNRIPDQLQEAKRPDAPAPRAGSAAEPARCGSGDRLLAGVLLQLQSERAHG